MTPVPLPTSATLRVHTLSDWHVGSGAGAQAGVNALIRRDSDELPYLPGTTLTGVYRESCLQVALGLDGGTPGQWTRWHRYLFGNRNSDVDSHAPAAAALRVRSARVSESLRARLAGATELARATTFVKPGVAIDRDTGRAQERMVRFVEMARAGLELTGPLELDADLSGDERTAATVLLVLGAAWLRALGGDRRRGSGEVEVAVVADGCPEWTNWVDSCAEWAAATEPPAPPARSDTADPLGFTRASVRGDEDWVRIPLEFTTVDAVRCPRATLGNVVHGHDHLPGTALLAWVLRTLEGPQPLRLALATGAAVVTNALPAIDGQPARPAPAALGAIKHAADGVLHNQLLGQHDGVRGLRTGWVAQDGPDRVRVVSRNTRLITHNVVTEHTGRPTGEDGGVFTVEAIPAGRVLRGELRLAPQVRRDLDVALGSGWQTRLAGQARIGAASKSEYGRVRVEVGAPADVAAPPVPTDKFTVWALADVLVRDSRLRLSGRVEDVVAAVGACLGARVERVESQTRTGRTESWQGSWRLPRPSLVGLAAGSCLLLRVAQGPVDPARWRALVSAGIGERRGEGFGQVAVDADLLSRPSVTIAGTAQDPETAPSPPAVSGELSERDRTYLDVVTRAALRRVLVRRVAEDDSDARHRLTAALRSVSRSQRGAVRELVSAVNIPGVDARLDAFLVRRAKRGAIAGLVDTLAALRGPTDNHLPVLVADAAEELGMSAAPSAALLDAFSLFVLDVLANIDAERSGPSRPPNSAAAPRKSVIPPAAAPRRTHRDTAGRSSASKIRQGARRQRYRQVHTRWELTATLVARTPLHVGGTHDDPYLDLTVARDGRGEPYVPGTSLAGVLRSWWDRREGTDRTTAVWDGTARRDPDGGAGAGEPLLASLITVADAPLRARDGSAPVPAIRDGVGIDRRSGAAAYRVKYEREILPAGTTLFLRLVAEDVETGQDGRTALADGLHALAAALRDEGLVLGAATTRGLGRLVAAPGSVELRSADIRNRTGILAAITRGAPRTAEYPVPVGGAAAERPGPRVLRLTLGWRPDGPLLVGANVQAERVHLLPLMDAHPDTGEPVPVLPGSSVKGIVRSEVERSVRTVLNLSATGDFTLSHRVLALACPPFEALFGSQDRRGALSISDTYAELPAAALSHQRWRDYLTRADDRAGPPVDGWQEATHVAVDRWSGGASDGMLYTVLEPHGVTWQPLRFDIDLTRFDVDSTRSAAITLLLYAVAALTAGTVPFGHGGTRGLGAVRIDRIDISAGEHTEGLPAGWNEHTLTLDGDAGTRRAAVLALARDLWPDPAIWTQHLEA
ncbi:RAMP superfamily CRISPR-associated protein [Actinokineospora sp.]|uniref:RAMP superfamily CRISPR-associated protein n=1 Tax=Actinokineospora sp. TaxID=1872133 RepID=UPI004037E5CF